MKFIIEIKIRKFVSCLTTAPIGVPRCTSRTVEFRGFTIPRHTIVLANLHSLHHSERYWERPDAFLPERWLDPDRKLIKHEAFMPFSTGNHYHMVLSPPVQLFKYSVLSPIRHICRVNVFFPKKSPLDHIIDDIFLFKLYFIFITESILTFMCL